MKKYIFVLIMLAVMSVSTVFAAGVTVNINLASAQELSESLNGIGLKKAQAIVSYRQTNGKFNSVKDLLKITL